MKKDLAEYKVTVKREVPYSELTEKEKIHFAIGSNEEALLELIANDASLKVRETLANRAMRIPGKILCELLQDKNQNIRKTAKARVFNELIYSNLEKYTKSFELMLTFVCNFFGKDFIGNLTEFETKRQALSAIYLYDLKYSFLGQSESLFGARHFNSRNGGYYSLYDDGQPNNGTIWKLLGTMVYYQYMPEELENILKKQLIPTENVENLQNWIQESEPSNLEKPWIDILSKTLFNLGKPYSNIEERKEERFKLCMVEGLEIVEKAEIAISEMYKTSAVITAYTKNV